MTDKNINSIFVASFHQTAHTLKSISFILALLIPSLGATQAVASALTKHDEYRKEKPMYILSAKHSKPDEPPRVMSPKPAATPKSTEPTRTEPSKNEPVGNNTFELQRGNLIPPVVGGYVSTPFGQYTHPTESRVTLENKGIDIIAKEGSAIHNVYHGTVARIEKIAGTYTVIIQHGDYYTVYSYLSTVNVKVGEKLATKANIGVIGKNDDGKAMLHFEVARLNGKQIVNENPAIWLKSL